MTKRGVLGLALVIAVSFCFFVPVLSDTDKAPRHGRSADQLFVDIESKVPGFGGLFRDDQGRLTVYLSGDENVTALTARIAAELPTLEAEAPSVRILRGDYAFSDLVAWRQQASGVHSIAGVSLTDVDEASNRVRIGIETEEAREAVEQAIADLGIPFAAVEIVVTGGWYQLATVQDHVRPVVGGLQVTFGCDATSCFVCTDGFLAIRRGVRGYVTNSHCTKRQGGNQDTAYYQPFPLARVGKEIADPRYFIGGACPPGRVCRFSDSAFVKRRKGTSWSTGFIAHPLAPGSQPDSLTIDTITPTFRITSENTNTLLEGDPVNKIGRSTGWTQGTISGTCVDVDVMGTNITMLCHDAVIASVQGGDSGAPVFGNPAGATTDVSLYGLLWGGNDPVAGTEYIYSPLPNIEVELGPLNTCDPLIGC